MHCAILFIVLRRKTKTRLHYIRNRFAIERDLHLLTNFTVKTVRQFEFRPTAARG